MRFIGNSNWTIGNNRRAEPTRIVSFCSWLNLAKY
jgi:hypothetical protein